MQLSVDLALRRDLYGTRTYCNHLHVTSLEGPREGTILRLQFKVIILTLFANFVVIIFARGDMY